MITLWGYRLKLFIQAWFIFTTLMLLCTLKSSLAMFSLFFFLDMNYLLLGVAHIQCSSYGGIPIAVQKAGGAFGILAAFSAWYNAFAGIYNLNNGFFIVPLGHFPWSPAVHIYRAKAKEVWPRINNSKRITNGFFMVRLSVFHRGMRNYEVKSSWSWLRLILFLYRWKVYSKNHTWNFGPQSNSCQFLGLAWFV